jgi:hypothetical protein
MTIKNYTILGERNSGTHFLQYAIKFNFPLTYIKNEKHFFGFGELDSLQQSLNETIVFCIVRDPIEWIDSFFKRLHHVPPQNKKSIQHFLTNEFYSIYEEGEKKNTEIMNDRNIITRERYENIFELRKIKNNYLMNEVYKKAPHTFLLRYEDLRDHYDETMRTIQQKFQLLRININSSPSFIPVPKYKGSFNALYVKKPILLAEETQSFIQDNLDTNQEQMLGYLL